MIVSQATLYDILVTMFDSKTMIHDGSETIIDVTEACL